MGAIIWPLKNFINTLLDVAIIKTGLVISEDYLLEILIQNFPNSDEFKDYKNKKDHAVRIRSEEFDEYCWTIRKSVGELDPKANPLYTRDIEKSIEWLDKGYNIIGVYNRFFELAGKMYDPNKPKVIDPTTIIETILNDKIAPPEVIAEVLQNIIHNQTMSNTIKPVEEILWDGGVELEKLFIKEHIPLEKKSFIDQKLINYLQANPDKLEFMHWRNFERLTAEFFNRQDYIVELGPGTNDGGVDLRVYSKEDNNKPYVIIQCKRHKATNKVKIETVKSFFTDVNFENAKKGLIATTSSVEPGGKKVVAIRKYPLEFAENKEVIDWVNRMTKR